MGMILTVRDGNNISRDYVLEDFNKDVIGFGRQTDSDIVFKSSYVSRLHGCIYRDNGGWYIKDLDSSYGLYFNGTKITNMKISGGEHIIIKDNSGNISELVFRDNLAPVVQSAQPVNVQIEIAEPKKEEGGISCPNCGSKNIQLIQEQSTKGKDFSGTKGCCGVLLLGPIGVLCGSCGGGKKLRTSNFWLCNNCGNKFKVKKQKMK